MEKEVVEREIELARIQNQLAEEVEEDEEIQEREADLHLEISALEQRITKKRDQLNKAVH